MYPTLLLHSSIIWVEVTSLNWSPIVITISSKNVTSQVKYLVIRSFFSRCPSTGLGKSWAYCTNATQGQSIELLDHVWPCGVSCWLDNDGLLCFMIWNIAKSWPLQFATCNLKTLKYNKSCGQNSTT